jgi:hypothetical protein
VALEANYLKSKTKGKPFKEIFFKGDSEGHKKGAVNAAPLMKNWQSSGQSNRQP